MGISNDIEFLAIVEQQIQTIGTFVKQRFGQQALEELLRYLDTGYNSKNLKF